MNCDSLSTDASGWAWFMPLHDGTRSVGIVQDQQLATEKRQTSGRPSTLEYYKKVLDLAPKIKGLLEGAELVSEIRSASDYTYTASTYHLTNTRIYGNAGCFIDPLFSSGVHLAITGGLSAAVTIMSSLRGDYDEEKAGSWHSKKTIESYTRFFLAVSSATKQIRTQHEPVLQDIDEEGFQRAFDLLRPSKILTDIPWVPANTMQLYKELSMLILERRCPKPRSPKFSSSASEPLSTSLLRRRTPSSRN